MTFDDLPDRIGTHSAKWDNMQAFSGVAPQDAIAMWVADMDFDAAPPIREALRREADQGFLGYIGDLAPVTQAVCDWMARQHGWQLQPEWVSYSHGVVAGFGMALEAFSDPGDGVILFTPVYHAFFTKVRAKGREVVESELVREGSTYRMDLKALEARLTGREKVVVLCSPHNPGGRLWSGEEIAELAAFCARHDMILLSDEIHMDLVFPGARHLPTALAAPEALDRLVVLTAASKGFNIAGGETGLVIVPDPALRARMDRVQKEFGGTPNRFGILMTKAAFTEGADWSAEVRAYLAENFALWRDRIGALPGIEVMPMDSTYLAWTGFENTGMAPEETTRRLHDAGIVMSPGAQFGAGGTHFHRFNLAMPRPRLVQAIERVEAAFADLQ
jgi:cystathionine beta-lyase